MNLNHIHPLGRFGFPERFVPLSNRTYFVLYDYGIRQAAYSMQRINDATELQDVDRKDAFREDFRIDRRFRLSLKDFAANVYDRGHLTPSADRRADRISQQEVDILSNINLQHAALNRGSWKQLEQAIRNLAQREAVLEIFVACGPAWVPDWPITCIGENKIPIPHRLWKSILVESHTGRLTSYSFSMTNDEFSASGELSEYQITLDECERYAGLRLWPGLPEPPNQPKNMW